MDPIEEYFFDNNIEVYKTMLSSNATYFSTSEGEYYQDDEQRLFKIVGDSKIAVNLKIRAVVHSDDSYGLTHYRREQLILKLAWDAMIKARTQVRNLGRHEIYKEGSREHWKLAEARKKSEELSQLYEDIVRSRVELIETEKD